MRKIFLTLMLMMLLVATVSCIGIQDSGDPGGASPTVGQEMIDLKKAHDAGAITYEEYKELKAKLMTTYD